MTLLPIIFLTLPAIIVINAVAIADMIKNRCYIWTIIFTISFLGFCAVDGFIIANWLYFQFAGE